MKNIKRTTIFCFFSVVLAIWLLGYVTFLGFIAALSDNQGIATEKSNPDHQAVIVLTGSYGRVDKGFQILADLISMSDEDSQKPYLFISGVGEGTTLDTLLRLWKSGTESEKDLIKCCIELGYTARNTPENAEEVLAWIHHNKINDILLVTADYHMVRAIIELKKQSFISSGRKVYIRPVQVKTIGKTLQDRIKFLRLSFIEYNKTLLGFVLNTSK